MRYGITETEQGVHCANCLKQVGTNGNIEYNYCPECGAPLTLSAINETNATKVEEEKELLRTLNRIAEGEKTDSFKEIIKVYIKERTE